MNNYYLIYDAIENKKQINCVYQNNIRQLCPHALGIKNARKHVLSFQFGGNTSKRNNLTPLTGDWRCMQVEYMENIVLVEGDWYTNDNHSQKQSCINKIDIEIDYK